MGWEEKRLFLVLIIWMEMLIFLLWCVKKKRKRKKRHFRKAAHQKILVSTELPAQMEWIPWPKGDSDDLLHFGTPGSGSLRVPLFLLLSLWEFQTWGQLKKEVIWSWGSYSLIGAVREGQRGQGRAEGSGRPLISGSAQCLETSPRVPGGLVWALTQPQLFF